jgi:hypothetical protein
MSETMSDPLGVLARIRDNRLVAKVRAGEQCELCGEKIPDAHGHLVDVKIRSLMCACRGCYLLFTPEGAGGGHYRAVPDRYVSFKDFQLSPAQWDSLQIPVNIAFFFINTELGRVAGFYPSPAGATESLLSLETWNEIAVDNPMLESLIPDVEAFLIRQDKNSEGNAECFLVPIDACYELVGHLRKLWRGFDGGKEAHEAMDAFFERVRAKAK